jgi:hypothetical protein
MKNIQSAHNNLTIRYFNNNQKCARKGCLNIGKNHAEIIYINKRGWFCDGCIIELNKSGLLRTSSQEN